MSNALTYLSVVADCSSVVHLYGVHDPAGHPGEPARHLGDALPHALLHVLHVRGLKVLVTLALPHVAAPAAGVSVEVHVGADAVAALEPETQKVSILQP